MEDFDFDAWCDLAKQDPPAFFRRREEAIEAFIAANPQAEGMLRALQAQIDGLRACAGSPMNALAGIMGLLDDHLGALAGQLGQLRAETQRLRDTLDREP